MDYPIPGPCSTPTVNGVEELNNLVYLEIVTHLHKLYKIDRKLTISSYKNRNLKVTSS